MIWIKGNKRWTARNRCSLQNGRRYTFYCLYSTVKKTLYSNRLYNFLGLGTHQNLNALLDSKYFWSFCKVLFLSGGASIDITGTVPHRGLRWTQNHLKVIDLSCLSKHNLQYLEFFDHCVHSCRECERVNSRFLRLSFVYTFFFVRYRDSSMEVIHFIFCFMLLCLLLSCLMATTAKIPTAVHRMQNSIKTEALPYHLHAINYRLRRRPGIIKNTMIKIMIY
jgi:hypothetical protein